MNYKSYSFLLFILIFFSCKTKQKFEPVHSPLLTAQERELDDLKNWHFKDIELDTVPGISLHRTYDSLLLNKKAKEIIVAVIDTEIDINHIALINHIWKNENEISDNQIDDDKNGYLDDSNGWNFLGNSKGKNNLFVNFEYTRILRKWSPYFEKIDTTGLSLKDSLKFTILKIAKKKYDDNLSYFQATKDNYVRLYDKYFDAKTRIQKLLEKEDYTTEELIILKTSVKDEKTQKACDLIIELMGYDITDKYVIDNKYQSSQMVDKLMGLDYNDRIIQGDNPEDLQDINYGNNKLAGNLESLTHGTSMAGIITGVFFDENIKIMPLAIAAYGDEHDKDITLAIRYAVDNGAKVINMSFYKEMSMYEAWVLEAIKYASDHDVLIVSIAGNDGLDLNKNLKYPNDRLRDGSEVSDNFILAGASNYMLGKDFRLDYSNYGSTDVDLFAPGDYIYTTAPFNEYDAESNGTSSAGAITSGVAALIRSYYPDLTASQVKHILMDSGIEYTLEVSTPTEEDPDKTTPFNQLSKSGKVLNAYNALLMAERISKGK
jgi:cell wall-associated protease